MTTRSILSVHRQSSGSAKTAFVPAVTLTNVYSAPSDLRFGDSMQKVAVRAHVGLYEDETAALCHWHIPETHYLESWSDVRCDDGTVTIVQPLIAPLYNGKSAHEMLALLRARLGHDPDAELRVAAAEQAKITRLRLEKLTP